ncbi:MULTISPECIES: chromate transporter [Niallia]|jgi:chromate transporter|uniref:Transporter n=1 Tax=Niallia circulans TaxID=1397 RepID=A0A268FC14_NIACI|nr:chromate transporter [Niallia circulans]AYV67576.1 chromate transporter [Niallia circulans]AYV74067.1 chromate transporter [Niallia circulans]NRG27213.1 chromate transporter [Niallia circulans]PAD82909.1 transporter [Niallia circulans]QJX63523.1 chromate transporter [Niallia circulans]
MYKDLILGMLRAGIFGFGGGPSVIPLFRHEAVTKYKWMANDEFGDALAIANTLPGPIATKLAAYIGYHQKGIIGAIVSVIAHILPTCLAMVFLFSFISILSHSPIITSMIGAVVPVIAVMLGLMAYEFGEKAVKGLGIYAGIGLTLVCLLLLQVFAIHPGIVVLIFLIYGAFHFKLKDKLLHKKERGI